VFNDLIYELFVFLIIDKMIDSEKVSRHFKLQIIQHEFFIKLLIQDLQNSDLACVFS